MLTFVPNNQMLYCSVPLSGPVQTYPPSMHPPTGYYGAQHQQNYPTLPGHTAPVSNKASITNSAHSANYYQNNHPQQQHHLSQHHVAPYSASLSSAPPSQPYARHPSSAPPPSNTQYSQQPFQQHPPFSAPASYYGPQSYHASPPQPPQQQQQPSLVPMAASGPGGPLYPIVSYPSAPGNSQYGTLSSSQSTTQMGTPLHSYSAAAPPSSTAGHPGYGTGPPSQVAPTVNGQGSTGNHDNHSCLRFFMSF